MSSYRYDGDLSIGSGERAQISLNMLRRGEAFEYRGDDRAVVNIAQDEDGNVVSTDHDQMTVAGLAARPSADVVTEVVIGNVGASGDHAVVLGVLDHGRFTVLDIEPLQSDETVLYNLQVRVKIRGSEIHLSPIGVDGEPLAFLSALQSLDTRVTALEAANNTQVGIFNGHVHPGVQTGGGASLPVGIGNEQSTSATSATITGTVVALGK